MGVGPGRTWDAAIAAHAPALTGDSVTFTALEDGTLVVNEDVPEGSLSPVADALEEMVAPPYRAAAARNEGDMWTAVAESVKIVELTGIGADEVELTVVDGERTLTLGDEQTIRPLPALDALAEEHESVASLRARLAEEGATYLSHIRDVADRGRLDDTFVDALCEPAEVFTYGGMIAHVLTFAAHRRCLVVMALDKHGISELGWGDPMRWVAEETAG